MKSRMMPVPQKNSPSRASRRSTTERYVIPNLRNACRILKFLSGSTDGSKFADIGRALDIPVTTTLRIMAALPLQRSGG